MVNKVTLIGNLGRDAEVRRLESGAVVAKIAVATTENYKDQSGNWQDRTEWHNVVMWSYLAEKAESSFKKGMLVYVEGKLTTRKWQDNNGQDRWTTEVVANYARVINNRSEGGGGGYANSFPTEAPAGMNNSSSGGGAQESKATTPEPEPAPEEGGDLPF